MVVSPALFGTVAVVMFAGTVGFLWFYRSKSDQGAYYVVPPAITGIAGVAYVAMAVVASGSGGERLIVDARYLDWLVTTPLIVYYLTLVADADRRTRLLAPAVDAAMIVVGYVATISTGAVKWGAFALSSAIFLYLVYILVSVMGEVVAGLPPAAKSLFGSLRNLTVFLYAVFPLIWLFGPNGAGVLSFGDHAYILGLLDLAAKVGFDAIIAVRTGAIDSILESAGRVDAGGAIGGD